MGFLDWFRRDKKLTDYSPEDLRREEGRLEIREAQAVSRLEKAEEARKEVFRQGLAVKSPVRRRILARKYEERETEIRRLESEISRILKENMTVSALRYRLERKGKSESALLKKIGEADVEALRELVENDGVGEEMYREKLTTLLGVLEGAEAEADPLAAVGREGRAVLEVWERMDQGAIASVEEGLREARDLAGGTVPESGESQA
ncbi:MAG: hypothetical protein MUE73_01985 [Planctomycetes bacterium]|jgi:hypothetical protein|nr:hypothetical protein [Planctomycetota bacterium]